MNPASSFSTILIYAVPTLLQCFVLMGGIIFGLSKMSRYPPPAKLLVSGLTVILICRGADWAVAMVLPRLFSPDRIFMYNLMVSFVLNLANTMGLVLMIGAVFVSRSDTGQRIYESRENRSSRLPVKSDSNPYTAPLSE